MFVINVKEKKITCQKKKKEIGGVSQCWLHTTPPSYFMTLKT
jgi:hypothetical protein